MSATVKDPGLDTARREAAAAKQRLLATAHELQARLKPATIANDALDGIKRKSEALADDAVDAVKRRPVAAGAAAAGIGALLGAGLIAKWRKRRNKDEGTDR